METNNEFIEKYAAVVRIVVKQYKGILAAEKSRAITQEDLEQEGYIGLIEAAGRYDEALGISFESFASWWVRRAVRDALLRYGLPVRIPHDIKVPVLYSVDIEEAGALVSDERSIENKLDECVRLATVERVVNKLPKTERKVIRLIFGLGDELLTATEVAERLGVTLDYVYLVQNKALNRIRQKVLR